MTTSQQPPNLMLGNQQKKKMISHAEDHPCKKCVIDTHIHLMAFPRKWETQRIDFEKVIKFDED